MELILLENVKNLGVLGQKVKVKPGFARNYLLPKAKAVIANKENIQYFEEKKEELQIKQQAKLQELQANAAQLNGIEITIPVLASDEGKLYGSITVNDIVEEIAKLGKTIKKQEVLLPIGGIKELGVYDIQLSLHNGEILVAIKLRVTAKLKS